MSLRAYDWKRADGGEKFCAVAAIVGGSVLTLCSGRMAVRDVKESVSGIETIAAERCKRCELVAKGEV